jgi:hypothetical protein
MRFLKKLSKKRNLFFAELWIYYLRFVFTSSWACGIGMYSLLPFTKPGANTVAA